MVLATNRRATFDYVPLETFTAGVVLTGQETKSVRSGGLNLRGSYVVLKDGQPRLLNAHIRPYRHAAVGESYEPEVSRSLLLTKRELEKLARAKHAKHVIIPLKAMTVGRHIKLEIAIAQPKKRYDKRETIKARDDQRQASRDLKSTRK